MRQSSASAATELVEQTHLVLIVDDDLMARRLLSKTLSKEGFQIVEASNGQEALDQVVLRMPDIILMDVEMPIMNGFDACEQLRALYPDLSLPLTLAVLGHRVRYLLRTSQTMNALANSIQALDRSKDLLSKAQSIAKLGSWEIDRETGHMTWSEELRRLLDCENDQSTSSIDALLNRAHPEDRSGLRSWFEQLVTGKGTTSYNHRVVHSDGSTHYMQQQVSTRQADSEQPGSLYGTSQDVSVQHEHQEQIRQLAYYDSLTGLPNREHFMRRIKQSLEHHKRDNSKFAVMFLDVDNFKRVNDTLGHRIGDLLLETIAERLQHAIRKNTAACGDRSSEEDSLVARFGGDEFTLMIGQINEREDAGVIASRILETVHAPMQLSGHELVISPSIGIAIFPDDANNVDDILKNADAAMYTAKRAGKNAFRFFEEPMNSTALRQLTIENELRKAIDRNEFSLEYQPQLDVETNEIIGLEALIRWNSQTLGLVAPGQFIPVAEGSNLISEVGTWVLRTATAQMKQWLDDGLNLKRLAINISVRQFMEPGFVALVASALAENDLPAQKIELEITESLLMQDVEHAIEILAELKELGVELAIDDFGTGYSSLNYLKRFPIDRLKIDQAFVREILTNSDDAAITRAVIAMATSMQLGVIAEGVETIEQLNYLRTLECSVVQGFHLSRPLSVEAVPGFLQRLILLGLIRSP